MSTLKRKLSNNDFPNAHKDRDGRWLIPVDDVVSLGYKPRKTWSDDHAESGIDREKSSTTSSEAELLEAQHKIQLLEVQLEAERQLRAAAELAATDLRQSLRMLESATTHVSPAENTEPVSESQTEPVSQGQEPARKRWWNRR